MTALDTRDGALQQMVVTNLPVARRLAREYRNRGIAEEDLFQVACEALVKAVLRFRPERGDDLLRYAVPTIRGEIRHHFRDAGWQVRPPRRLQELQWRVVRSTDALREDLGREPTPAEIQADLGIDAVAYGEAMSTFGLFRGGSLDEPVTDGDSRSVPRSATLVADTEDQEETATWVDLKRLIAALPERDRQVLRMRFVEDLSQREIGDLLGVTQVTVSRWLGRIVEQLRSSLLP